MSAVVYRFFDVDDRLIYIGSSTNLAGRLAVHECKTPWFHEVASIKVAHFPTHEQATEAEKRGIADEHPLHNVYHKPPAAGARTGRKRGRPFGHAMDVDLFDRLILQRGTTLTLVARSSGIPLASLSTVRHGHGGASVPRAFAIAAALDVEPCLLFPTLAEAAA